MKEINTDTLTKIVNAYAVIQTKIIYDKQKYEMEDAVDIISEFYENDEYYKMAFKIIVYQFRKGTETEELDIYKIEQILKEML